MEQNSHEMDNNEVEEQNADDWWLVMNLKMMMIMMELVEFVMTSW